MSIPVSSYTEDDFGNAKVICEGITYTLDFYVSYFTTGNIKPPIPGSNRDHMYRHMGYDQKYYIYFHPAKDSVDEYEMKWKSIDLKYYDSVKKIIDDFIECKRKSKLRLEEKRLAEEKSKKDAHRIFPIKGSAKPTNPWKVKTSIS